MSDIKTLESFIVRFAEHSVQIDDFFYTETQIWIGTSAFLTFNLKCIKRVIRTPTQTYEIWKRRKGWKEVLRSRRGEIFAGCLFQPRQTRYVAVVLATGSLWGFTSAAELGKGLGIFLQEKYNKLDVCFHRADVVRSSTLGGGAQGFLLSFRVRAVTLSVFIFRCYLGCLKSNADSRCR